MNKTIKGVNLGGWLIAEKWMTPSLFEDTDASDEFSLLQVTDGVERIRRHHKTFMTEEDWEWLASHDITHVRLPVGYWVLEGDAPYISAKESLDWAFKMANQYDIKILLDLHGLKGSQNGTIHSGQQGSVHWRKYMDSHFDTLRALARRYRDEPALWGIEIINEPKVVGNYFALLRYYRKAYALLRAELKPGTHTVFQDGFMPPLFAGTLWPREDFPVVMDTHFYLLPSNLLNRLSPEAYDKIRGFIYALLLRATKWRQPVIVGEWSSILPQPQFDKTPQDQHLNMLGKTIRRQSSSYTPAMATFYWNYKTEGQGMYNYRSLIEDNIL
jgi:glucan 1,3-beta-glucosidase